MIKDGNIPMDLCVTDAFVLADERVLHSDGERKTLLQNPGFGRVFTDHRVSLRFTKEHSWHEGTIQARNTLNLDPATMMFHQAQGIFEGMKAYRQPDDAVALFRPDANARRFHNSAVRLGMPSLPESLFIESLRALVSVDRAWMPAADDGALYLRPFMIATEQGLLLRPADEYLYSVIASPVSSYFKRGAAPVTLWVSESYTRAAPGGTGNVKCAANYAGSLAAQMEAIQEGCDQVVFLDAVNRRWIEELGGMNIFFIFEDGSLQTPPIGGTILPGVTRDSLIMLAREFGWHVREEPYSIDQWQSDAKSGRLREAFACGTAAVVTPIGAVKGRNHHFTIGAGTTPGPVTERLKTTLLDIQYGRAEDKHGWVLRIS